MSCVETIHLIHHSHLDIGYTHDQPIVLDLHERFISEALALAERAVDGDGAFRWTIESAHVLERWLRHASARDVERLQAMERAGRIEVTAMFANLTPLADTDELLESLQLVERLRRDYGFTITSAMNCDVNGQNWPLVDLLLDAGISGFSMNVNGHFGGAPLATPAAFRWRGPSGREILAYSGWSYTIGSGSGIGDSSDKFENVWWPVLTRELTEIGYPLPVVLMHGAIGDNGSVSAAFTPWIDAWNARGKLPRIKFCTPREWWSALSKHAAALPVHRGDWTDYWNFGCGSSARETTASRQSRVRLRAADALAAAALGGTGEVVRAGDAPTESDPWLERSLALYRKEAWENLLLWYEHTWGPDIGTRLPDAVDTAAQWNHKAHFAHQARSLSLLLRRDAVAALARRVERTDRQDLLLVNSLPFARTVAGLVPKEILNIDDTPRGRHFQDRQYNSLEVADSALAGLHGLEAQSTPGVAELMKERFALPPTEVPAFGYVVVPRQKLVTYKLSGPGGPGIGGARVDRISEDAVVENDHHRLRFNTDTGGVIAWDDKSSGRQWVDGTAGHPLNGFVHEEVADRAHPWPRSLIYGSTHFDPYPHRSPVGFREWRSGWRARRRGPTCVLSHRVFQLPMGLEVVQLLEAPGISGPLALSVFLPNYATWVEFRGIWRMGQDPHPEATYLVYPFDLPGATARFDLGGMAVRPETDQLPGVCRDYFTVQNWVDFNNGEHGVTIATPDNPMVQLGDFHFAHNQSVFKLERAMFLGWVTNTYWETNFRAHQPGAVTARYRVQPYAGAFDEARAHRFGQDAASDVPLLQHLGEPTTGTPWPASASLLRLPDGDIQTLHVKPAGDGGVIVRLLNASDAKRTAAIASGLLTIAGAVRCDLFDQPAGPLDVRQGALEIDIAPRQVAVVKLLMAPEAAS